MIIFVIQAASAFFAPKPFSPTGDFKTKITNQAIKLEPVNVYNLWLRGEEMRGRAMVGAIKGLGFVPYIYAEEEKDKNGNKIYLTDKNGNFLFDEQGNKIPKRKLLASNDGDVVFVVKQGGLIGGHDILIRCNRKYCTDLVGEIYIKDVNVVPFGDFFYPAKQWVSSIESIMAQHKAEAIVQTFYNDLDLISDVTRLSIAAEPSYQKLLNLRDERLVATPTPSAVPQGGYR